METIEYLRQNGAPLWVVAGLIGLYAAKGPITSLFRYLAGRQPRQIDKNMSGTIMMALKALKAAERNATELVEVRRRLDDCERSHRDCIDKQRIALGDNAEMKLEIENLGLLVGELMSGRQTGAA